MATSPIWSGGRARVAPQQLADDPDDEIVGPGLGVQARRAGLAERAR